jgi:hypothetical protein
MQREYNSIIKNKIYILVNLSKGRIAIKDKWIFDVKITKSNEFDGPEFKFQIIFKNRWVAKDFLQRKGIDFDQIWVSVVSPMGARALIA